MPKHAKYVPSHRGTPRSHAAVVAPKKALRNTLIVSSVAVTATGVTVGGGLVGSGPAVSAAAADADDVVTPASFGELPQAATQSSQPATGAVAASSLVSRRATVSRSFDRRTTTDQVKAAALSAEGGPAVTGAVSLADSAPKDIALALLGEYGWDSSQFGCLDSLWTRESGWNPYAQNSSSGAYGIPQSLPGSKMASVASDWATNPVTQIRWGLGYIQDRYGSPCGAWGHSEGYGWY